MVIESKDILFIVLAAGFIVLVIFISLALVQLTRALKDFADIEEDVRETTLSVKEGVDNFREKMTSYGALLAGLGPFIKKAMDSFAKRSSARKKGK
jgi:hypothetical protein